MRRALAVAGALARQDDGSAMAEYIYVSAAGASAAATAGHMWGAKLARMFGQLNQALGG